MLFLVVIFLSILVNVSEAKQPTSNKKEYLPYRKRRSLMNESEQRFFEVLQFVIHDRFLIFSKVRIWDLVYVKKSSLSIKYQNQIKSKHVDFVICSKEGIIPLLIIELDGSSHNRIDRQERDIFVDRVFEASDIPIVHMTVSESYNTTDIHDLLSKYLINFLKS